MTLAALAGAVPARPFVAAALLAAGLLVVAAVAVSLRSPRTRPPFGADAAPVALAALLAALAWRAAGDALAGADAAAPAREALAWAPWAPLVLLAVARGPLLAAPAALGFAAFGGYAGTAEPAALQGVVAVLVSGWWALQPTPAERRTAAPLALLAGAVLATATVGWAAQVAATGRAPQPSDLLALADRPGVLAALVLVALAFAAPPPAWWRAAAGPADPGATNAPARRTRAARRLTPPPDPGPLRRR